MEDGWGRASCYKSCDDPLALSHFNPLLHAGSPARCATRLKWCSVLADLHLRTALQTESATLEPSNAWRRGHQPSTGGRSTESQRVTCVMTSRVKQSAGNGTGIRHLTQGNIREARQLYKGGCPMVGNRGAWGLNGQVWTRHLAPAASASRPSLPSPFHSCSCLLDNSIQCHSLGVGVRGG